MTKQFDYNSAQKYDQARKYSQQHVSIPASWIGVSGNARTVICTVKGIGTLSATETYPTLHGRTFNGTSTYEYGLITSHKKQFIVARCAEGVTCNSWEAIDIKTETKQQS